VSASALQNQRTATVKSTREMARPPMKIGELQRLLPMDDQVPLEIQVFEQRLLQGRSF